MRVTLARVLAVDTESNTMKVEVPMVGKVIELPIPSWGSTHGTAGISTMPDVEDRIYLLEDGDTIIPLPTYMYMTDGIYGYARLFQEPGDVVAVAPRASLALRSSGIAVLAADEHGKYPAKLQLDGNTGEAALFAQKLSVTLNGYSLYITEDEQPSIMISAGKQGKRMMVGVNVERGLHLYVRFWDDNDELTQLALDDDNNIQLDHGDVSIIIVKDRVQVFAGKSLLQISDEGIRVNTPRLEIDADEIVTRSREVVSNTDRMSLKAGYVTLASETFRLHAQHLGAKVSATQLSSSNIIVSGETRWKGNWKVQGDMDVSGVLKNKGEPVALERGVRRAFAKTYKTLSNLVSQFNTHIHPLPPTNTLQPMMPMILASVPPQRFR